MARYWKFVCLFFCFGEFIDYEEVYGEKKKQQHQQKQKQNKRTSPIQVEGTNADNYARCWEDWFVEVRELEETAVGITAGSDDNTSVKEHDKITDTRNCFQLLKYYISYCLTLLPSPSLCVLVRIDISE